MIWCSVLINFLLLVSEFDCYKYVRHCDSLTQSLYVSCSRVRRNFSLFKIGILLEHLIIVVIFLFILMHVFGKFGLPVRYTYVVARLIELALHVLGPRLIVGSRACVQTLKLRSIIIQIDRSIDRGACMHACINLHARGTCDRSTDTDWTYTYVVTHLT